MNLRKYTEAQLREAIRTSLSIREALQKLQVAAYGGNYDVFRKAIEYFQIDTSHFLGKGKSKLNQGIIRKSLSDYLTNQSSITSNKLRKRLLREGILPHKCAQCGLETWLDEPIPLELHHKDGDRHNNSLENLSLLCPNCHSLTDGFRGRIPKA